MASAIRLRPSADILLLFAGFLPAPVFLLPGGRPRRFPGAEVPPSTPSRACIAASSLLLSVLSCWTISAIFMASGRPKGSKNLATIINKVCFQRVKVKSEDGKQYYMPKMEAVLTQLVNGAAKGDERSARTCLAILKMVPGAMDSPPRRPPKFVVNFVDRKQDPENPTGKRTEIPLADWLNRDKNKS